MLQLEWEGFVETIPTQGSFVRRLGPKDIADLCDLRVALEGHAAERAASRITTEQLRRMRAYTDQIMVAVRKAKEQKLDTWADWFTQSVIPADMGFHAVILSAAGNDRLVKCVRDAHMLVNLFRFARSIHERGMIWDYVRTVRQHRAILRALRRRDGKLARRLVETHITAGRDEVLAQYDINAAPVTLPAITFDDLL
jgi:DNA-binding GntR family transcriptional regulator